MLRFQRDEGLSNPKTRVLGARGRRSFEKALRFEPLFQYSERRFPLCICPSRAMQLSVCRAKGD